MGESTAGRRSDLPHREVADPVTLRGMAHPLRMQLLDALAQYGPATSSQLAERTGSTQANCSWHLRQLHRYGFIEEAVGGTTRWRPWRLVKQTLNVDISSAGEQASAIGIAATALSDVLIERQLVALRQWRSARFSDAEQWREAAQETQTWGWLTADEFREFTSELNAVVKRHIIARLDRIDPDTRPPGCRAVRHVSWSIPSERESEPPAPNSSR